jgi:pimeloyl-ACP methyl ester carboxylesterase
MKEMFWRLGRRYEDIGLTVDADLYPPPGQILDVNGRPMHVHKLGSQPPTVILDAGIAASSVSWTLVHHRIAEFATVYAYDRAGYGWSPYHSGQKIARGLVEEMRATMQAAGAPTPRILVGHSFGGMMMRIYASMYPREVSGIVFVDALSPDEWFPLDLRRTVMLRRAVQLSRRGVWLADRGVVRYALHQVLKGNKPLTNLFRLLGGPGGVGVSSRIAGQVKKLPPDKWPIVRAHWSRAASFQTMAEYLAELPASCAQGHLCKDLGDTPLIVLAAEFGPSGHQGRQARLAKLSTRGDYRMVPGTNHWLMLDAPDAVVEAVKELIDNTTP